MSEAVQIQNITNAVKLIVDGKGGRFEVPPQETVVVLGDLKYFKKCIEKGLRGIVVKKYTGTKIPLLESKVTEEPVPVDITNKTKILKIMVLGTGDRIELYPGETKRVVAKPSVVKIRGVEVRRVKKLSAPVSKLTPPITPPPPPKLVPVTKGEGTAVPPSQEFDGTSDVVTGVVPGSFIQDFGGVSGTEESEKRATSMAQEIDKAYGEVRQSEKVASSDLAQAGIEMQAGDPMNRPVWEQLELPETEQEFREKVNSGQYGIYDLRGIGNQLKPAVSARSIKDLTEKIVAVVYCGVESNSNSKYIGLERS